MCISPILIPNTNRRNATIDRSKYRRPLRAGDPMSLKDCTSQYIPVPCGHCCECVQKKQNDTVQRTVVESLNSYLYFLTLTYDNAHLPTMVSSTGELFSYASVDDIQKCFKRVRKYFHVPFRYYAASERGSKKHRPHWHVLLFVEKKPTDNEYTKYGYEKVLYELFRKFWSINIGTRKNPEYEPLYTYRESYKKGMRRCTFDLHLVEPRPGDEMENVAFYVSKYAVKYNDWKLNIKLKNNYSAREAHRIYNMVKCRSLRSISYGTGFDSSVSNSYVRECIDRSKVDNLDYPMFFYKNGNKYSLSSYLRKKYMTMNDALHWYFNSSESDIDSIVYHDDKIDINKINNKINHYGEIQKGLRLPTDIDRGDTDWTVDSASCNRTIKSWKTYELVYQPLSIVKYKKRYENNLNNFDYDNEKEIYSPVYVLGNLFAE